MIKAIYTVGGIALLAVMGMACSSAGIPTGTELAGRGATKGKITAESLDKGRTVMIQNCASCHRLIAPEELTVANWKMVIPNMARRSDLSGRDTEAMEAYILAVIQSGKGD